MTHPVMVDSTPAFAALSLAGGAASTAATSATKSTPAFDPTSWHKDLGLATGKNPSTVARHAEIADYLLGSCRSGVTVLARFSSTAGYSLRGKRDGCLGNGDTQGLLRSSATAGDGNKYPLKEPVTSIF